MTVESQMQLKRDLLSKWTPEHLAKIIEKLVGDKSNLRVVIPDVRITIRDQQLEVAGEISFNVLKNHVGENAMHRAESCDGIGDSQGMEQFDKVRVFTGDLEVLRINVEGKRVDLDIEDKQFIKRVIQLRGELSSVSIPGREKKAGEKGKKKAGQLGMVKTISDTCKRLGLTLTVSYRGKGVVTIGADASPTILHYVTKTRALAINSLPATIELLV